MLTTIAMAMVANGSLRHMANHLARSSRRQMRIGDRFFEDRPYRVVIIFEGPSEEKAITMMLKTLYIDDKLDGIMLHNAKGLSNIEANLGSLFDVSKKNDIDVFEIVDDEKTSKEMCADHMRKGFIKEGVYHIWEKDYEYDNFGATKVVKSPYFCDKKVTRKE